MFPNPITTSQLAGMIGAEVQGDGDVVLQSVAALDKAGPGDLTFAIGPKHVKQLEKISPAAAIVPDDAKLDVDFPLIRVPDVPMTLGMLLGMLSEPEDLPAPGVHPTAYVAESTSLGKGVCVGPQAVIGEKAMIGDNTAIAAGAKIGRGVKIGVDGVIAEGVVIRYGCKLGNRVRIGSNTVIGYDGYGYHFADGVHHKVPHAGNVVIEDDVEIGACTCVDRAKWGSTLIGQGAKVDNLVQIAHNVEIGPGCLVVAQVGIAGSAKLGSFVVVGGQAGIRDNIELGDGVQVSAAAHLMKSAEPGETLVGTPARDARRFFREVSSVEKLPDLIRQVREMKKQIEDLQSRS